MNSYHGTKGLRNEHAIKKQAEALRRVNPHIIQKGIRSESSKGESCFNFKTSCNGTWGHQGEELEACALEGCP